VSNEISLHSLEHVCVSATRHIFLGNLVVSFLKTLRQLGESLLVVSDRTFDLSLLDVESVDLFPDTVVLVLFLCDKLFGRVVLLFDN